MEDKEYRLRILIDNDPATYRAKLDVFKRLAKHKARGTYDKKMAHKGFAYLMEMAAKKAEKEDAEMEERSERSWHVAFPKSARDEAAQVYADEFEVEWKAGHLLEELPKKYRGKSVQQIEAEAGARPKRPKKPKRFTLAEIRKMPTLRSGHTDNVVYDDGTYRVSVSRMTIEDGMPYDHQVTVEKQERGAWREVEVYKPRGARGSAAPHARKVEPFAGPLRRHRRGGNPETVSGQHFEVEESRGGYLIKTKGLRVGDKTGPPTWLGTVNKVTGAINVWSPAGYKPRGHQQEAKRVLEEVRDKLKREGAIGKHAESYFTVVIPMPEGGRAPTRWHGRGTLTRGAYKTKREAEEWARSNLAGHRYSIRRVDPAKAHRSGSNPLTKSEKRRVRAMGVQQGIEAAEGARAAARRGEVESDRDSLRGEAYDIEEHSRQYAGHPTYDITREFGAPEREEYDIEEAYEEYDEGVSKGVRFGLRAGAHQRGENPMTRKERSRAGKKAAKTRAKKKAKRSRAAKKAAKTRAKKGRPTTTAADLKLKQRMRKLIPGG